MERAVLDLAGCISGCILGGAAWGVHLGDKESVSKLLQRKHVFLGNRRPGPASAVTLGLHPDAHLVAAEFADAAHDANHVLKRHGFVGLDHDGLVLRIG